MNIIKIFNRESDNTPRVKDDENECSDILLSLTRLTKLIADDKLSKFCSSKEAEIELLENNIEHLRVIVPEAFKIIAEFDFHGVRFSGYRSFFSIIKKCVQKMESSLHKALHFRFNRQQIEDYCSEYFQCLSELTSVIKCLYQLMTLRRESRNLFLNKTDDPEMYLMMMDNYQSFASDPFYGHCLGFYLCDSCQSMAKIFCSLQLGLGQAMSVPKSNIEVFVSTVANSTHSWFLEHKRGSQMCSLFKQATVTFCKQFWNLVDNPILTRSMQLVLPNLKVIRSIVLKPIELEMPMADNSGAVVKVLAPSTGDGFAQVNIRLLSNRIREGMEKEQRISQDRVIDRPSKCVLMHCHGGGFVAQSSQSHDGYLRQWAIDLDCPIVSVDYSHAPEFPYPRAHEECFYAYCWVLSNLQQFGCDIGARVVICGDSAGGNLALSCVVRALQLNIRAPDGVFVAYPATVIDFIPSPARMLGVIDPILPIGVLARCLLAYVGVNEDSLIKSIKCSPTESGVQNRLTNSSSRTGASFLDRDFYDGRSARMFHSKLEAVSPIQLLEKADIKTDPILSPLFASDDIFRRFPPLSVVASEFDPLLDDSVELCKRIDAAGSRFVRLQVMANLPHGFLSMSSPVTRECSNANHLCIEEIRKFFLENYL